MFSIIQLAQAKLTNPFAPNLSPTDGGQGADKLSSLIGLVIQWLFVSGILIFILFFFISAFKWMTSQGDKNSLENARQGLLHAIVGLVILFSLFAILKVFETVFHVCVLQIPIPVFGEINSKYCIGTNDTHPTFAPGRPY